MSQIREVIEGLLTGRYSAQRSAVTSFAEMSDPDPSKRPRLGAMLLGLEEPKPAEPEQPEAAPDSDDALFEAVALQIDVADAEAIRADPEAKRRFVRTLRNQRELNADKLARDEAKRTAEAEAAKVEEQNRLARLGREVAKRELSNK